GLVAAVHAAVVLVEVVGLEQVRIHFQALGHLQAAAQVHRHVAVAVAVGFIGKAAGAPAGSGSAAGIDAVGFLVAGTGRNPATRAAVGQADGGVAQAVAANAQRRLTTQARLGGAGE